jgi:hypothetical protein
MVLKTTGFLASEHLLAFRYQSILQNPTISIKIHCIQTGPQDDKLLVNIKAHVAHKILRGTHQNTNLSAYQVIETLDIFY